MFKTIRKLFGSFLFISVCSFIIGFCFFCFYQEWIVLSFPFRQSYRSTDAGVQTTKRKVLLFFWKHELWKKEEVELLWSNECEESLKLLANRWLALLEEETLLQEKIIVESVIISPSTATAFLSFDRNPFDKEASVRQKLMFLESLLKTVRTTGLKILHIYFLVQHTPLIDYHLDFSNPWPIEGFLGNK